MWELKALLNRSVSFLESYEHFKRGFPLRWMNLELIIQSEVSQKEKNKYHILMNIYIWNLEKWY